MPKLIIIPGAGSSELNWLDIITHFQQLGFSTHFINYKPESHSTFHECSEALKSNLDNILNSDSLNAPVTLEEPCTAKDENIILAHSMGSMLLLNIILETFSEDSLSKNLVKPLERSSIFLIQCPAKSNPLLVSIFKNLTATISYIMHLHQPLEKPIKSWLKRIKLKTLEHRQSESLNINIENSASRMIYIKRQIEDSLWILAAMHISAWGSPVQSFKNLAEYYIHWNEYSKKIINKDKQSISELKIQMTVSNSDIFCDKTASLELAKELNATVKEFDWTFHNPMHFPWSQEEFINWVKRS